MTARNIYVAIMVADARGTAVNFLGDEAFDGWAKVDPKRVGAQV